MNLSRLNGWQRIWVVIAVIWLIFAILNAIQSAAKHNRVDYKITAAFNNPECQHIVSLPKGFALDKEPEFGTPCFDLYFENKFSTKPFRSAGEYEAQVSQRYHRALWIGLGLSLIGWAIGLALLYGAGVIVAWVIRGFRSPSGAP